MRFIIFMWLWCRCLGKTNSRRFEFRIGKKKTLNPEIGLQFGKQDIKGKKLGTFVSNMKTNASNKYAEESCRIAFLSAVKSLQYRAEKEGGNAVVNIHSYYKKVPSWSDTTYHCEDGNLMSGVALRGTVVKQ